ITELQKQNRAHLAELAGVQHAIGDGRPPPLPEGKTEVFHYHGVIPGLALRQYASGKGVWLLGYRTKDGRNQKRTLTIGDALVTTLKQAEKAALAALEQVRNKQDPQGDKQELHGKRNRLLMTRLERNHPELVKRIEDKELTVAQAAAAAGLKLTVGGLCEEYLKENYSGTAMSPLTLDNYRYHFKNHLGPLRGIPFDELGLDKNRDKISTRVKQINEEFGRDAALQFSSGLSSVYKSAMDSYPGTIKYNPIRGTWRPKPLAHKYDDDAEHEFLLRTELAAIWRACETMAATASTTYKGNAWGAVSPAAASSMRADSALLTTTEAERQSGLGSALLQRAIQAKELKACRVGDLPGKVKLNVTQPRTDFNIPEIIRERGLSINKATVWDRIKHRGMSLEQALTSPLRQGKGQRDDFIIEAGELRRFAESRSLLMRSPQYEYSVIIRLLLLLGVRYSIIGGLCWSELGKFNSRDKFVPSTPFNVMRIKPVLADGTRRRGMKAKHGKGVVLHRYLPPLAIELINTMKPQPGRDLIFGSGPHGMLTNDAFKKQLDGIIAKEAKDFREWNVHMLRHSFTTHVKELGCPANIMSAMLNHIELVGSRTTGIYDHATYMDDQKKWMDPWTTRILNDAHGIKDDQTNVAKRRIESA
ncbi:MAG: tyrosine-type recombinase/integrase, partial [Xanthobacteraceae bacterium]